MYIYLHICNILNIFVPFIIFISLSEIDYITALLFIPNYVGLHSGGYLSPGLTALVPVEEGKRDAMSTACRKPIPIRIKESRIGSVQATSSLRNLGGVTNTSVARSGRLVTGTRYYLLFLLNNIHIIHIHVARSGVTGLYRCIARSGVTGLVYSSINPASLLFQILCFSSKRLPQELCSLSIIISLNSFLQTNF